MVERRAQEEQPLAGWLWLPSGATPLSMSIAAADAKHVEWVLLRFRGGFSATWKCRGMQQATWRSTGSE